MSRGGRLSSTTHLGRVDRQALAGADEERHVGPAPGVDVQLDRREGLDRRVARDARLVAVAAELPAHDVLGVERRDRLEHARLLVADRLDVAARPGAIHRQDGGDLQQVVLDDVADRAGLLVEAAAALRRRSSRPS